jgi:acylglycerol lipase
MHHFEYTLRTADGLKLFGQGWEASDEPRAVVCLVHGLGEHSGRYAHLAKVLTQSDMSLMAFDLRGHGKSEGQPGHTPSIDAYMGDIELSLTQARRRYPGRALFLYGHSLGGLLVLNYELRCNPELNGVIASAPGLKTSLEEQPLKIALSLVLGKFFPRLSIPSGLETSQLSRDPQVVKDYEEDPLVHDRTTLGFARTMIPVLSWTFEHAATFSSPLLIVHGAEDKLAYPQGSCEFARALVGRCDLKLFEGLRHEIHNEPEQEQVFHYLLGWIEQKLAG